MKICIALRLQIAQDIHPLFLMMHFHHLKTGNKHMNYSYRTIRSARKLNKATETNEYHLNKGIGYRR